MAGAKSATPPGLPGPMPGAGWPRAFGHALAADLRSYALPVAGLRSLRRLRALLAPAAVSRLLASRSQAAHAAAEAPGDLLSFLSHRHYLARGLSARARIAAAECHYLHQDRAFCDSGFRAVYLDGGLRLWVATVDGRCYDILLTAGRDVTEEGGLSLVLRLNGGPLCVLSFSLIPREILNPEAGHALPPRVWFIGRKHLSHHHDYQPAFHKAFHRVTAAQMVMAAFAGLARATGHGLAVGIGAARHPSNEPARAEQFEQAYDGFWTDIGATPMGPDYLIPLPLPQKPLDAMDAARRKRTRQRRAVQQAIETAAAETLAPLLRPDRPAAAPQGMAPG